MKLSCKCPSVLAERLPPFLCPFWRDITVVPHNGTYILFNICRYIMLRIIRICNSSLNGVFLQAPHIPVAAMGGTKYEMIDWQATWFTSVTCPTHLVWGVTFQEQRTMAGSNPDMWYILFNAMVMVNQYCTLGFACITQNWLDTLDNPI